MCHCPTHSPHSPFLQSHTFTILTFQAYFLSQFNFSIRILAQFTPTTLCQNVAILVIGYRLYKFLFHNDLPQPPHFQPCYTVLCFFEETPLSN